MTRLPDHVVPHEVLPRWLGRTQETATAYSLSRFAESERPADLVNRLAEMIMHAKVDPDSLRRLLARVGWLSGSARLAPSNRAQPRHGDFGEVVGIGLITAFAEKHVPVVKLRVQMDPDQSLHGSDIVGFQLRVDGNRLVLDDLEFVEVKCRTTRNHQAAVEAHAQLASDRVEKFADTLEFLHSRLYEIGDEDLMEAFETYLGDREANPEGSNRLIFVFDREVWKDSDLEELPEDDELCSPLSIDVLVIANLKDLIDQTWSAVPDVVLAPDGTSGG